MALSRITTVSAFKKDLASMDVSEPVVVTQNGEPLYVVQDPVQFEMQQEQMSDIADTVFALLFLNTRQSIREALTQHCLKQE